MKEYDFQHFAAQKVAFHRGEEHLPVWRREGELANCHFAASTTTRPEGTHIRPKTETAEKEYDRGPTKSQGSWPGQRWICSRINHCPKEGKVFDVWKKQVEDKLKRITSY